MERALQVDEVEEVEEETADLRCANFGLYSRIHKYFIKEIIYEYFIKEITFS